MRYHPQIYLFHKFGIFILGFLQSEAQLNYSDEIPISSENVTFSPYKLLLRPGWAHHVSNTEVRAMWLRHGYQQLEWRVSYTWIIYPHPANFFITHLFLCIFKEIDSFVWPYVNIYFLSNRIWLRNDYSSTNIGEISQTDFSRVLVFCTRICTNDFAGCKSIQTNIWDIYIFTKM